MTPEQSAITQDEVQLRRYLLGLLEEAAEGEVELRLLSDADYAREFDIVERELIDQYVEDALPPAERDRFERHFLRAPQRKERLAFAKALRLAAAPRAKARRAAVAAVPRLSDRRRAAWPYFPPAYLKAAAVIVIALCVGLVVWLLAGGGGGEDAGLLAVREVYRNRRVVEARVTGLDYTPLTVTRGPEGRGADEDALRRAELQLLNDLKARPDAATHHALGRFYLAGNQIDKALKHFEEAARLAPKDARIQSDLGAAFFEKGKAGRAAPEQAGGVAEFGRSLEHFNRALELDGSLLEALFNRALLYREMSLPPQAESDWRSYLEKDPGSGWAEEARRNLRELEERRGRSSLDERQALSAFYGALERGDEEGAWEVLGRSYTSSGNAVTNALVESLAAGRAAGGELRALDYIAQLESRKAGDGYTAELARSYRAADPARRRALAAARAELKKGYAQYLGWNLERALQHYGRALAAFEAAGSEAESVFTRYLIGLCHVLRFDQDPAKAEPIFQGLLKTCAGKGYAWLCGQCLYRVAMLRLHENKYSEAIEHSRRALEALERVRDVNGTIKVLIQLSDQYQSLNDERQSLAFLQRALSLMGQGAPEPSQVWSAYTAAGLNCGSLGLHAAALEYQKEAARLAEEMGRPLQISRAQAYLGLTYANLRRYDEALAHIGRAAEAGASLSGDESGQEMAANTSLYAGEVHRWRGDYERAVESYDRAINFYARLDFPYFRHAAHKGKLLALLARNDDPSVEQELQTVLGLFEQYRTNLTGEGHRNTFFDVEQKVYDQAVNFAYARKHDAALAFDYSELSRARSLLDAMREGAQTADDEGGFELRLRSASAPLRAADIQRQMPAPAQILQYAVLEDRLLIWVVDRSGVSAEEVGVGARELEGKVRAYLRALKSPQAGEEVAAADRAARELYAILIRPVEARLDSRKLLCVVPDKILHYLPFGALVSAPTGRYLVEDFRLGTAASSSVFVECSEAAAARGAAAEEALLSVGDPSFDRAAFASLAPLPSARAEARAVAAYYKPSVQLVGDAAREEAVRSEVVKAEVANFALHYVVDERSSARSGLVLAGARGGGAQGGEDGVWRVHEIFGTKLPRTRLVVLSACRTGVEQDYGGEGTISAARPFIAAGVPLVVASLWAVESDSTARLVVSLHRHRTRERLPTAEALRRAQLELLRGEDPRHRHPFYWAAFTATGGHTEF